MTNWQERSLSTIPFVSGATNQKLQLPRDNPIRWIALRFRFGLTTGAAAPTYTEDDILNLIKKIRVVANGNDIITNVSGRMAFYIEKFEKKTQPFKIAPTTAVSTTADAVVTVVIDYALNRLNENDKSALLLADTKGSLDLLIDWGSVTDLASANAPTINASEVTVEIRELANLPRDAKTNVRTQKLRVNDLREIEDSIALLASKTSFDSSSISYNIIPAPSTIFTHGFMVLAGTTKTNADVTSIKVQKEKGGKFGILERSFNVLREEMKTRYEQESLDTGFLYLDYIDRLEGGLPNQGNEGDMRLRLLTSASVGGSDSVLLFIRSSSGIIEG